MGKATEGHLGTTVLDTHRDAAVVGPVPPADHSPACKDVALARFERRRRTLCRYQADLLFDIPQLDELGVYEDDGFNNIAEWVSVQLGNSVTQAWRWVRAARVMRELRSIPAALRKGDISIDKALELTRFVTPADEERWLRWAKRASVTRIRNQADRANRASAEQTKDAHARRYFNARRDETGTGMWFDGYAPADQGELLVRALDRIARDVPDFPEDEHGLDAMGGYYGEPTRLERRRLDALVQLCSLALGADADKDRATVVIHERLENLTAADGPGAVLEGGGIVHPDVLRRLCCDARIQMVIENGHGAPIGLGHMTRTITPALRRLLIERDGGCTFPGCNSRRYLDGHHIVWWTDGGPTDLDNLTLTCGYHHKLVHEFGWKVELDQDQRSHWYRPDGTPADTPRLARGPTQRGPTGELHLPIFNNGLF